MTGVMKMTGVMQKAWFNYKTSDDAGLTVDLQAKA